MKEKAPGKTLLQVVGILLVVFGVLSFLLSLVNIATLGMMDGELGDIMEQSLAATGITMEAYKISIYLTTAASVLNLIIGIIGIANCNKIKRANICFICGIILLIWQLGNDAYTAVTTGFSGAMIISVIIGLILPVLYFWGAVKNRQALQDGVEL